jgi:hypothetical protein
MEKGEAPERGTVVSDQCNPLPFDEDHALTLPTAGKHAL